MLEIGKLAGVHLVEIPREVLTESVPGKAYHITIETKGVIDEQRVVDTLTTELYTRFKAKVIWMRIVDNVIDIQLIGSPFVWAALLAFLPTILGILGIVVVLISLYSVLAAIPGWTWGLLAVGIGMILFGPKLAEAVSGGFGREMAYKVTKRSEV